MYHYFVSYSFSDSTDNDGVLGVGYTEVIMDKPLITLADVHALRKKLSEQLSNLSNIIILYFQLLRVEAEAK